jgi:hypothetical protein
MKILGALSLLVIILFSGINAPAQDTGGDSYTIQRLIIYNNNGEVLLEKHKNGWMTPALRHSSRTTIKEGLENLASEFGLTISPPKLAGNFMFISEYKPTSSFRQHYTAKLVDGDLTLPEEKLDAGWFSPHDAVELMSLPDAKLVGAVGEMTEQVLNYPEIIWGGTFTLWKENDVTVYQVSEHFYPIGTVN